MFCYLDKYYIYEHVVGQSGIRRDKKWIYQCIFQFGKKIFLIWTHTFCNLDKYILQFGLIHFEILTNIKGNPGSKQTENKWIYQFGKTHFVIWTNIFVNLDKYEGHEHVAEQSWIKTDGKHFDFSAHAQPPQMDMSRSWWDIEWFQCLTAETDDEDGKVQRKVEPN